ncbi:MAG: phosphate acyltransferase PlsX [Rhodobacteraceae bacterium]|nr:phosphate acyltransferase PlsX [Paracoccaceae bacterium]
MSGPGRDVYRRREGLRHASLGAPNVETRLAVDVMGGDADPTELVAGIALFAETTSAAQFVLCGDKTLLTDACARHAVLDGRYELRHADRAISMKDKPGEVIRRAEGASMTAAIDCVSAGEADCAVSSGNTGALMALSSLRLGRLEGVSRPAIAALWPTIHPGKQTVVLDVGADVKMEPLNLSQFAIMGAVFARIGLGLSRPKIGLLNIGAEAHKGRSALQEAAAMIEATARTRNFVYHGFVEANDIPTGVVDVVVTDGFTGNVALKAAEGTAKLIQHHIKSSLTATPMARIGAALAAGALREMKQSLDPRRVNGGILLGLRGAVVKSHGDVDALGFSAAAALAARIGAAQLPTQLSRQIAIGQAA